MNFRQATDELIAGITLEDLADAMNVSIQAIRQARANEGSKAHRPPPEGWAKAISLLAEQQSKYYKRLAEAAAATSKNAAAK
jgi:hypothetical protein